MTNGKVSTSNRKTLMKALDGLGELREDLEKKEEKRTWREINLPASLYEALSRLTKDELSDIRKKLEIQNASSLNKEALIKLLVKNIPDMFEEICLHLDTERYSLIEKAVHHDGAVPAANLDVNKLTNLGKFGILFTGLNEGKKWAVIPDELLKRFPEIDHSHIKTFTHRNSEWIKLVQGLLYYYGTLSMSQLIEIVKNYSDTKVNVREFITVILDARDCYKAIKANANGFSNARVFDSDRVAEEHRMRRDVPFYPFTKEQLLIAGVPGYVERNKSYRQFVKYLTNNYDISREEADGYVEECVFATQNGHKPQDMLQFLQHTFTFEGFEDVQACMEHVVELRNNTRQWFLKGHTPKELSNAEKEQEQPSPVNKDNVIPFTKQKKTGRNDACPCGSGKKYKKCCGRGT